MGNYVSVHVCTSVLEAHAAEHVLLLRSIIVSLTLSIVHGIMVFGLGLQLLKAAKKE